MINNLDITMTATIRPEVVNLTLKSFFKRFLYQIENVRLIINIDPIGDERHDANDVIIVCKKYFQNIIVNTPNTASFPKAAKWCWEQIESEFFLHLEDDWLLRKNINSKSVFELMSKNDEIKSVRFFLSKNKKTNLSDNRYCYSNGFSLNPSIVRTSFIKEILKRFDTDLDPEKQFSDLVNDNKIKFILYGNKTDGNYTIDIGKKWRKLQNFDKPNISLSSIKSWKKRRFTSFNIKDYLNYKVHMFYWEYIVS